MTTERSSTIVTYSGSDTVGGLFHPWFGPFVSSTDNVYVFSVRRNDVTQVQTFEMYKSTHPIDNSWTEQDTTNNPSVTLGGVDRIYNVSVGQYEDLLHIVVQKWNILQEVQIWYMRYNMSTDAFHDFGGGSYIESVFTPTAPTRSTQMSISGWASNRVTFVCGNSSVKIMGTDYVRPGLCRFDGTTWSVGIQYADPDIDTKTEANAWAVGGAQIGTDRYCALWGREDTSVGRAYRYVPSTGFGVSPVDESATFPIDDNATSRGEYAVVDGTALNWYYLGNSATQDEMWLEVEDDPSTSVAPTVTEYSISGTSNFTPFPIAYNTSSKELFLSVNSPSTVMEAHKSRVADTQRDAFVPGIAASRGLRFIDYGEGTRLAWITISGGNVLQYREIGVRAPPLPTNSMTRRLQSHLPR